MADLATFCILSGIAWATSAMPIVPQTTAVVRAVGTVEPAEMAEVFATEGGLRIKAIGPSAESATKTVDYGSHVKKDDLLVQFDEAENALLVQKAKAGVQRAIADYDHAKAETVLAEQQIKRLKRLANGASATADDADITSAGLDVARARVRGQEAVIAQAKAELKLAELHLDACSVRSPIDGVIIDRRINVGQTAPTKVALFLIASDPAKYQVWANVEEISIAQIAKGQTARFTVDTLPKKQFTGRVSQIRFNAQVVNNAVRYTVVIDVDDAKGLVPYQTADVFINTEPSK